MEWASACRSRDAIRAASAVGEVSVPSRRRMLSRFAVTLATWTAAAPGDDEQLKTPVSAFLSFERPLADCVR
jgi:hypothetical protein